MAKAIILKLDSLGVGYANDAIGYTQALENFDKRLPKIYAKMADDDILFLTADHG